MAKIEQVLNGDFKQILDKIERGILNGNIPTAEQSKSLNI